MVMRKLSISAHHYDTPVPKSTKKMIAIYLMNLNIYHEMIQSDNTTTRVGFLGLAKRHS